MSEQCFNGKDSFFALSNAYEISGFCLFRYVAFGSILFGGARIVTME